MIASAAVGLILDAAMGGLQLYAAFTEFRKGRPPDETKEQAAAGFVAEMVSQIKGEEKADAAIEAWLAKHDG